MNRFAFERNIFSYLEHLRAALNSRPLALGGVSSYSGGSGGPAGGFIGKLPQSRITFDLSESAIEDIPTSGESLVDNLNRIRYRIHLLEDMTVSGVGAFYLIDLLDVDADEPEDLQALAWDANLSLWTPQTQLAYSGFQKITVGITQPANPVVGDLWVDTN